jgi:hypothetical protein
VPRHAAAFFACDTSVDFETHWVQQFSRVRDVPIDVVGKIGSSGFSVGRGTDRRLSV